MRNPIILAGLLALAALPAAQAQETLKLGALVTLSGAGAAWGQGMKNAAEVAADQVNEAGGLEVGGKKYRVQVVAYDDKYQPTKPSPWRTAWCSRTRCAISSARSARRRCWPSSP